MTLLERPNDAEALGVLSIRLGLKAAPVLERHTTEPVRLKWPNDIIVGTGKVAGILVETRWRERQVDWVAIGFGVNVERPDDEPGAAALREGGILLTKGGKRLMEGAHPLKDLAPRDVVARAIDAEMKRSGAPHLWLDMTSRPRDFLAKRFPTIDARCRELGLDMAKDPLPVGTSLKFEFQLKDASPLITGDGTVVWTRDFDPTRSGVAPGMGVRFDRLPSESQEVLEKILAHKTAKLGKAPESFLDTPTKVAFGNVPTKVAPADILEGLAQAESRRTLLGVGMNRVAGTMPPPSEKRQMQA